MMNSKLFALIAFFALSITSFHAQNDDPLWLRYCAISPDGSQIAFCYKGDIFLVNSSGGEALQLTSNEAYDYKPVWSHDSQTIAFSSNRFGSFDIFTVSPKGGTPNRVTYHSSNDYASDFSRDNQNILFESVRLDDADNQLFPSGAMSELYSIPANGGRAKMVLGVPAVRARYSEDGTSIVYEDVKGYEDEFRKHHTSSVTRDIWTYNIEDGSFVKQSSFNGEDRDPIFVGEDMVYFLSEKSGSINLYSKNVNDPKSETQLTFLTKHPIRTLSRSDNGSFCFSFNGELYTYKEGGEPSKVTIEINVDQKEDPSIKMVNGVSGNTSVSSNGKEIAFVYRGEVFVTSVETAVTKRITNTPEQERNVHFSPDGKMLVYAGERDGSWNLYTCKLKNEDEKYFFNATLLEEAVIVNSEAEEFQPQFSPDGKEIAYLKDRTELMVYNIASKKSRSVMTGDWQYSYADGDQYYTWAPDSKWLMVQFLRKNQWIDEVGLVDAKGGADPVNLTESGYGDFGPKFAMGGKAMTWISDRDGLVAQASWGGMSDIYIQFFDQETYDKFKMTEEEMKIYDELNKDESEEKEEDKDDKKKKDKDKDKEEEKEEVEPLKFDLENLADRKMRLTMHSGYIADYVLLEDGSKLYYLIPTEGDFDLWEMDIKKRETKIIGKSVGGGSIELDKEGKNMFIASRGGITKIDLGSKERKGIAINSEMNYDPQAERAYMFEHMWRQVREKFYVEDLHGVDWDYYKTEYAKFLPHINNGQDFAEMSSELLGELNASHTGCFYMWPGKPGADATASLGLFYDNDYDGDGLKITEVMAKSPVIRKDSKIAAGVIVEKIDGVEIKSDENYFPLLNRKANKIVLLSLYNPKTKERWDERVKPISMGYEFQLRYERWVENCRNIVEEKSGGKIGYVHVRGMNNQSFKEVYSEALGPMYGKDALIVDTRFNGGGWLHDDLCTFLSGEAYMNILPRGQKLGHEPIFKWTKPSAVVMSEANYSDAHLFPAAYKMLGIGDLIGMPVAGTGTAVWWEGLIDPHLVFGIPMVGMVDQEGNFMENTELEPDHKVALDPNEVCNGRDQQLEKAVEVLMK